MASDEDGAEILDRDLVDTMSTICSLEAVGALITFSKRKEQLRDIATSTHIVFAVDQGQREMRWRSIGDSNRQKEGSSGKGPMSRRRLRWSVDTRQETGNCEPPHRHKKA